MTSTSERCSCPYIWLPSHQVVPPSITGGPLFCCFSLCYQGQLYSQFMGFFHSICKDPVLLPLGFGLLASPLTVFWIYLAFAPFCDSWDPLRQFFSQICYYQISSCRCIFCTRSSSEEIKYSPFFLLADPPIQSDGRFLGLSSLLGSSFRFMVSP